jgi:5'-deoxynucleotidase YfbR-like HD superfamily hydrolase
MNSVKQLEKIRRANNVQRFHTRTLLVPETVGHHSSNVAHICIVLTKGEASKILLQCALYHDLAEYWTGDSPATVKWTFEGVKESLTLAENVVNHEQFPEYVTTLSRMHDYERGILKIADMLDLCLKCLDEISLGNRGMREVLNNGIAYLDGLQWPQHIAQQKGPVLGYLKEKLNE